MGRVATILRFQWKAYTHHFPRGAGQGRAGVGVLVLAVGLFLYRYLQTLPKTTAEVAAGETRRLEMLLAGVLFVWMFPLLGEARFCLSTRGLRRFPLDARELFGVKVASSLMQPYVWVIVAGTLAVCYPLASAPNPKSGAAALVLYASAAFFVGHTLSNLLSIASWRVLLYVAAGGGLLALGLRFMTGAGAWPELSFKPSRLVVDAATDADPLRALASAGLVCAASAGLAFCSFRLGLRAEQRPNTRRFRLGLVGRIPCRFGGLVNKDLRYFTRLLDFYLGLLIAVWAALYVAFVEDASPHVARVALMGVPLFNLSAAFNYFGFETATGFDRYGLLPLSGRDVIVSKNLSFVLLVAAQLCPFVLLASWRFGPVEGLLGVVEVALLSCGYLAWGNVSSVRRPFRMQPFRFSSGGSPVELFAGAAFGSMPGVVLAYVLYAGVGGAAWKIFLLTLVYGSLYWASVAWAAGSFELRREDLRRQLV
ncbi:MAG TPA: hypothetical protein VF297_17630 [Pyrinomonadaceae bacterium]